MASRSSASIPKSAAALASASGLSLDGYTMVDAKTRLFNYNGRQLVSILGREAFPGERVFKLPTKAIEFAGSQPLTSSLLPCRLGYFPRAKGQKVSRPNGDWAFTLLFCLDGFGTVRLENGSHRLGRGRVALLRPFECHTYVADERHPWSFYWIHFNGTQAQQYYDLLTGEGRNVCIDVKPDVGFVQSFEKILNVYQEGSAYRMLVAAAGTLHQLLSDLCRPVLAGGMGQVGPRERIERTIEVMRHSPDMHVSMHELAAIAHMSHSHYALHFRRHTGKSPRNYFIRLKLAKACEHLVQTTAKIESIAHFVGYEDPFYFCRVFKRFVGRTPTQFRHNPICTAFLNATGPVLRVLPALGLALAGVWAFGAPPSGLDTAEPQAQRAEDLLSRMTLEEKVGQMCQYLSPSRLPDRAAPRRADDDTTPTTYEGMSKRDVLNRVRAGQIGSFLNFYGDPVAESNELQQTALESRLKIPLLFGADAVHGHAMTPGTTVFPTAIGLAATFDEELVRQVARVTAAEMRATGFNWCWGPNVEVARDQRWGRVGETFGEDPLLVARLGVATVRGLQGDLTNPETDVLACAKHFIGGSQPIGGQNHAPADFSERTLREVFLPPFAACVRAGVYSVMAAHNEVNGIPCHANSYLLTDVLKGELGFKGVVISDWMDVSRLWSTQHIAASMAQASELAVGAGLDVHMHGPGFYEAVVAAVRDGRLPLERVNDATRRILRAKFAAGLFERPFTDPAIGRHQLATPDNMALALQAARESIVLLRNEGGILPLRRDLKRIFVTGPNAADTSPLGDWSSPKNADRLITMTAGLERVLGDPGRIDRFDCGTFTAITAETLRRAAARARGADVAVIFVGGHPNRGGGAGLPSEGENYDRFNLGLPGRQLELVQAVQATGVPTVVVLLNGGAIAEPWLAENCRALVDAFYPGQPGGQAVAEVLFGDVNPSGRLPYSIPRGAGSLPGYYYERPGFYSPQGRFADLGPDQSKKSLFPFGYGLSYTTFTYSNLRVPAHIAAGHDVKVTFDLKNTGSRAGSEVVLTFVSDLLSSVTMPVKLLKAFQHVDLEPGEKKSVSLTLPGDAFSLLNAGLKSVVEPGPFAIAVGDQRTVFTITAN